MMVRSALPWAYCITQHQEKDEMTTRDADLIAKILFLYKYVLDEDAYTHLINTFILHFVTEYDGFDAVRFRQKAGL